MVKKKQDCINGKPPTSKYIGVSKHPSGRWVAQRKINGINTYLGIFKDEISAAIAYDTYTLQLIENQTISKYKRINFDNYASQLLNISSDADPCTVKFTGVTWCTEKQVWKASIQINKQRVYLGAFSSREEAARTYNAKLISEAKNTTDIKLKNKLLKKMYAVPETSTFFPCETYRKRLKHKDEGASNVVDDPSSAGAANNTADDIFLGFVQYISDKKHGSISNFIAEAELQTLGAILDNDHNLEPRFNTPSPILLFSFDRSEQDYKNLTFDDLLFSNDDICTGSAPDVNILLASLKE